MKKRIARKIARNSCRYRKGLVNRAIRKLRNNRKKTRIGQPFQAHVFASSPDVVQYWVKVYDTR